MTESRLDLPDSDIAPKHARTFVRDRLVDYSSDLCDDVVLMVSELVTNAYVHGGAPAHLEMTIGADRVRIAVYDGGASMPTYVQKGTVPPRHSRGRGLVIVAAVASTWGITAPTIGSAKSVWFELLIANYPSV